MAENETGEKALAKIEYQEPLSLMELEIPEAQKVFERQRELMKVAEEICEERDFMWAVHILGSDDPPILFSTEQEADARKKRIKKDLNKDAEIIKVKKKAAWNKLALALGVTAPVGQRSLRVQKETTLLENGVIVVKTTGPGYESMTFLEPQKLPDGSHLMKVLHSECTIASEWARAGRLSVRSGGCSSKERKFAHGTHDIIAMAETRASSRSIATCLGFGDTTAEEFEEGETGPEEPTPKPKEKPKSKGKKDKDEAPKSEPTKEKSKGDAPEKPADEKPKDEEDSMEKRKRFVKAATTLLKNDSKAVLEFFEEWKQKKELDAKAKLSEIDTESWKEFEIALTALIKEKTGLDLEA